jgi:hypothetical protein
VGASPACGVPGGPAGGAPGRATPPGGFDAYDDERESGAQHLAKSLAGVVQPGHHRPHRNAEHLGDLAVLKPFNVAQNDNGTVML